MPRDYILTCDAGTTGCKATVFSADGTAMSSVRRSYDTEYPKPNWSEQSADLTWKAVVGCVRELLQQVDPMRIAVIGLSGTMNGCIPVDAAGNALYPNIIHSDSRAWPEVKEIGAVIGADDFYRLTGNRLDHHYTLPKILWLRKHMPGVYERARWWLNTKDFIYGKLTGRFGYTDYSDASLTIALDIRKKKWAEELLGDLRVDVRKMPEIRVGHDVSGKVSVEASKLTGLRAGTPVAIGGGDGACTARGAGLSTPGSAYSYIGSSAWVSQLTDEPLLDKQARIFNYLDMDGKSNHACGTVQCGAAAYDWAIHNLLNVEGADMTAADYSRIENMARQIEPGCEGVLFLPTLMGERTPYWDANTRGALIGFSLYHDKRHIARAVYEGVAFALNSCAEVMRECGRPVTSLMLTGGGARSGLWPAMIASIFGVTTRVHQNPGESTSLGAAITAGVGVGIYEDYAGGAKTVRARSSHEPNEKQAKKYERVYPVYAAMYERLKPLFDEISISGRFS